MQLVSPVLIRWILIYPVDSAIERLNKQGQINLCPVDNAISFSITYPLDSDLSGGERYPTFEQPGPDKSLSSG